MSVFLHNTLQKYNGQNTYNATPYNNVQETDYNKIHIVEIHIVSVFYNIYSKTTMNRIPTVLSLQNLSNL